MRFGTLAATCTCKNELEEIEIFMMLAMLTSDAVRASLGGHRRGHGREGGGDHRDGREGHRHQRLHVRGFEDQLLNVW